MILRASISDLIFSTLNIRKEQAVRRTIFVGFIFKINEAVRKSSLRLGGSFQIQIEPLDRLLYYIVDSKISPAESPKERWIDRYQASIAGKSIYQFSAPYNEPFTILLHHHIRIEHGCDCLFVQQSQLVC